MYAVIRTGAKQYRVQLNDIISLERLDGAEGDSVVFDQVLMLEENGKLDVGTPFIEGKTVSGTIIKQKRARKIIVFKKRRRKNSRTTHGHRQYQTVVEIDAIAGTRAPKAANTKSSATKASSAKKDKTEKPVSTSKPSNKASVGEKAKQTKSATTKKAAAKKAPAKKLDTQKST